MNLKRRFLQVAGTVLLLPGAAAAQSPPRGYADALLGRWDLTIQGPEAHYPSWLEVRLRTEDSLMGRFVGRVGSVRPVTDIQLSDGNLAFSLAPQYEPRDTPLRFTGTLTEGMLQGQTRAADGRVLSWTGTPAPELPGLPENALVRENPRDLLAGDNLDATWSPRHAAHPGCWQLTDGILGATPPCVDLITKDHYRDFHLRLEFRYPPGSNSGVYLRGRYEIQIQDDAGLATDPLRTGGIYGFVEPRVNAAGEPGQWQTLNVLLLGRRVTVALNGQTVIMRTLIPGITGGALDSREGEPGPLMLQGDHGPVEFRNIAITPVE